MLFKVDENLPVEVADLLRQHGHDALTVPEQKMAGRPDGHIASVCLAEGRIIITLDLDFADIRTYPPANYHGIIVLRPVLQTITSLTRLVSRILPLLAIEPLSGCLWVVDESQVRIRGIDSPGTP